MIRRACVIGWPLAHSRSPVIHRFWLAELGIEGDYIALPVEPPKVARFLAEFPESGFVGANVTIPHKQAAYAAVAEADPVAQATGAVNTLWLEGRRLCGANTDADGFLANLDQQAPGWDRGGGRALILGAGGAARAIAWGLTRRDLAVAVVNRTPARAEELAAQLGPPVTAEAWRDIPRLLASAKLLVNATPLGLRGQPAHDIDLAPLADSAIVADIVYVPLKTPLLAAAEARRLATVDGLGMLLHQAVPGFERWFGQRPVVGEAVRAAVVADLDRR
jgi:shikimate dehydrogenase